MPSARGHASPAIRPEQVEAFLGKARPVTITWHTKFRRLRSLFPLRHQPRLPCRGTAADRDPQAAAPFVPYIFSHEELRRLFQVIDADQRKSSLEPATMRTLILLLYGAGLRLREAVDLTRADVDLRAPC